MEKTYTFTQNTGGNPVTIEVKESELTKEQKHLLHAEFLKKFLDLPREVQIGVINTLLIE